MMRKFQIWRFIKIYELFKISIFDKTRMRTHNGNCSINLLMENSSDPWENILKFSKKVRSIKCYFISKIRKLLEVQKLHQKVSRTF